MNATRYGSRAATVVLTIFTTSFLTWVSSAGAALQVVEQSYELRANAIERWPLGDDDSIVLRPCGDCESVVLRVNAQTNYGRNFSGSFLTRTEFMRSKGSVANLRNAYIFVFFRPDDKTVTRIILIANE